MTDGEAMLTAKWKVPEPLSPEEEAERQKALEESKRISEVVDGAGIDFKKKIKAKEVKGKIEIEGTCRTIIKGWKCPCGEKQKITEEDIIGAGGGPNKPTPFAMVSKFQFLVEEWNSAFSPKMDSFGYAEALLGWYAKLAMASEMSYGRTGNATIKLDCFNCRRIHTVRLKYEAPEVWPTIEVDPVDIWEKRGVNLKNDPTKRALDQFANSEGLGLAKDALDFIERELGRMYAVKEQLRPIKELVESLDLPGSGGDVRDLELALNRLNDRAEKAQRYFAMGWLFKVLAYMGEYYRHTTDEAEKLLRGNWRPPEWYHEGR